MISDGLGGTIFIIVLIYGLMFPFTIMPQYFSIRTLCSCECKHKRRHHMTKITGYEYFAEGIQCVKFCRICNKFCNDEGLEIIPRTDLRKEYLPKFQEMEYESTEIRKPLNRKINIRL